MEELAGKSIDRALQFLNQRKLGKWKAESVPFETCLHLGRLTHLASLIVGRSVRAVDLKGNVFPRPYGSILRKMAHPALLPDHGFAWTDGESLFLPVSLIDMSTKEDQEDLARLIVFFWLARLERAPSRSPLSTGNASARIRSRPIFTG